MKEIKLKFLSEAINSQIISDSTSQASDNTSQTPVVLTEKLNINNLHCRITTVNGKVFNGFILNKEGESTLFGRPEPHPIVLYFALAQSYLERLENSKDVVLLGNDNIYKMLQDVSNYFGFASSFSTFLFSSLESFINKMIPKEYEYRRLLRDKTEILNKEQIQRHVKFEEKIKVVIPDISGKYFHKEHGHLYEKIIKLKNCRDMIVHTKNFDYHSPYGYLFNTVFNLDNEGVIDASMAYINYYEPGLIEIA